jgi:glycosyltransferase involved in cell wall biosynthesis
MDQKIALLHIMPSLLSPAGTPRKLLSLVQNCDAERYRHVFLLFANHGDNLVGEVIRAGGIVEEVIRPRNHDLRLLYDIFRMVRKYKIAIINTHFARSDIYGLIVGMLLGIPVIKYVHGIPWNDSRLVKIVDAKMSPLRAFTVCNSKATLRTVMQQTGVKKAKVIYNGVSDGALSLTDEAKMIKRASLGLPRNAFVIGHVGGMLEWRDQVTIIRAVKQCLAGGMDAYLLLVGDGPLRKYLESESMRLGISNRVIFTGYRNDIRELNAIFDIFINMAREEGFGIAVVEAMQASVPVILADAGALPELIEDGDSGLIVSPGNSDSLYKSIESLYSNRDFAIKIGINGCQRALANFSISRYVVDIERLYAEIMLANASS